MEKTSLRIKRVNAMMSEIITGNKKDNEIYNIEKQILEQSKPNSWNVYIDGNMEKRLEVDFQKFGVAVVELTGLDLDKISTFSFYASVEYLKEKHKSK